ncbi:MAG TPA: alpha/beta fold hydrolase [Anaerolineales bacterium]|nr:alpha/beta fold hydrolase [Anaerolineales bacterium]
MIWWILALALLSLSLWVGFRPMEISKLESRPNPVASFEEAVARVKAMQEQDNLDLAHDVCVTKLYDHGRPTEHVIVLLHGFTNCPEQFNELGKQYYEAGNNVFIPRMPYHGLSDRLTEALVNLTAENLAGFGEKVVDIAHGLGKKVTVMGISGTGTLVAWLAQNRADVDYALSIAPLFGLAFIPPAFTRLFERIALLLPNFFMWWDPRTKADNPFSIYYAYPRYPSRALVEIMRLGMITRSQAEKSPPAARNITMIINDAEPAVSNAEIVRLLRLWRKHGQGNLSEYHFEKDMKLPHDIITPGTPGVPIGDIQPRLIGAVRDIHANH